MNKTSASLGDTFNQSTATLEPALLAGVSLSIVFPCYNESENLPVTLARAQQWLAECGIEGEIIVVDDGSHDSSLPVLKNLQAQMPNLKVLRHPVNLGYGAAIRSGCDAATHEWIAFMDSDGQFQPSDLSRLFPFTRYADYVSGIRVQRADTFHRKLNSALYSLLVRAILGVHPTDLNCGMKLFRRDLWPTIRPTVATGALINGEMFFALKKSRVAWAETPVPHYPRLAGKPTGDNPLVILRMFKELFKLKFARTGSTERKVEFQQLPPTIRQGSGPIDLPRRPAA